VSDTSGHRGFVIAVCGLRAEARIAARSEEAKAIAGGGDARRLGGLIQEQIARGGKAIISFGIAAGLAPGLDPGTCVVATEVVSASDRRHIAVNRTWTAGLRSRLATSWQDASRRGGYGEPHCC
jgi:adenosylhomocysteine nucleosidase